MITPDTLVVDSVQIAQWQSQHDFDYNRELVGGGMTFTEWLMQKINELMDDLLGEIWGNSFTSWLLALLGLLVLVLIGLYVWRHYPGLFRRAESLQPEAAETEDTIYGVDFEASIRQAVSREDWYEAIRLRYLYTLKDLSDSGRIDWQPFKTPTQYVQEVRGRVGAWVRGCEDTEVRGREGAEVRGCEDMEVRGREGAGARGDERAFRMLTAHFLRVRYGNFPATHELYDEVCDLGKEVIHGT